MGRMVDIDPVDLLDRCDCHAMRECPALNQWNQLLTRFRVHELAVPNLLQPAMSFVIHDGRKNDGCGNDRPGKRTAANFIDSGNKSVRISNLRLKLQSWKGALRRHSGCLEGSNMSRPIELRNEIHS